MATYALIWGLRIRDARLAAGMTKTDLANALGVDQSVPGRWELGIITPRDEIRPELAAALGVDVDDLFRFGAKGGAPANDGPGDEPERVPA